MNATLLLLSVLAVNAASPSADLEFFEKKVRPVLDASCFSCHGPKKMRGGLRLDSRAALLRGGDSGPAVVPGQPEKSLLIQAIRYHKDDLRMPPKEKLPDPVIRDLTTWVERGAHWPETVLAEGAGGMRAPGTPITEADRAFWSFRPVADPPLPAVRDSNWPRKPLDRFILAKLEAKGLRPVAPASREALIRRVTFDLIGLPPTPAEVEAFVNDRSPVAYERLVERLLASPAYGEKWARHWLDVARYGEDQAHTFQARVYPQGYRYRDWVVRAFNADLPYDEFIRYQIAGDLLGQEPAKVVAASRAAAGVGLGSADLPTRTDSEAEREDRLAALGFFALGPVYYNDAGEVGAAEAAELDDRIDTLSRGFLGLTVACARCHDHKFDPITVQDYYGLAGVFRSSQYQLGLLGPAEEVRRYQAAKDRLAEQEATLKKYTDTEAIRLSEKLAGQTAAYAVAAWKLHTHRQANPGVRADQVAREEKLTAGILDRFTDYLLGPTAAGRPWLAGWRQAVQGLKPTDPAALSQVDEAARALQNQIQELLAKQREAARGGKALTAEQTRAHQELFGRRGVFQLAPAQLASLRGPEDTAALNEMKARVEQARKEVPPALPTVHTLTEAEPADMPIYQRGNPRKPGAPAPRRFLSVLSRDEGARFTKGSGRLELAECIASRDNPLTARVLVNRVWLQFFGKGIVGTPSNFGSLGERPSHPELLDHLARRFMERGWSLKELHREILMSATYQLSCARDDSNEAADPANKLYWRMDRRRLAVEAWRDALLSVAGNLEQRLGGPPADLNQSGNRRRTIYGAVSRHNLSGLLRLFDFPDPNLTSEKRPATIVPLQQLFVLNSDFMVEQSRSLARRLQAESSDERSRIRAAYQLLYGRPARDAEVELGLEFLTAPEALAPGETKPALTRWEEYAQVLLSANEFTFVD
jgi:hypothetical protein